MPYSKRSGKVHDVHEDGANVYFTPCSKSKPSETTEGVYDLAGENVDGIYDLSKTKRDSENANSAESKNINTQVQKWRKRMNPYECKEWILMHRQLVLIIAIVTMCLIIGIGVPLSLWYRTRTNARTVDARFRNRTGLAGIKRMLHLI